MMISTITISLIVTSYSRHQLPSNHHQISTLQRHLIMLQGGSFGCWQQVRVSILWQRLLKLHSWGVVNFSTCYHASLLRDSFIQHPPMDSLDSIVDSILIDYWERVIHLFSLRMIQVSSCNSINNLRSPPPWHSRWDLIICTPENREVEVRHCATILSLPCVVQRPKPICKHLIYVHTLLTITTKSNLSVLIMSCGQITKKANTRIDTMIILLKVPCR